jgi:hypothetical protein
MKAKWMALAVLMPALAIGAQANGDYPITVHVQSSEVYQECGQACMWFLKLHVTMDGKKYVLEEEHQRKDLLRVGNYQAKIVKEKTDKAYEYSREYEFSLPDGEKQKFLVIGEIE